MDAGRAAVIAGVIVGVGTLIGAAYSSIILAIFTPIISVTAAPNSNANGTIIDVTNTGSASAKDLKLTVQAPPHVTFQHPVFSTERYTQNRTEDPSLLELFVPRFVQGAGSLIRINTFIASGTNTSKTYTFYATYDQGSILKFIPILQQLRPSNVYALYIPIILLIISGITSLVVIYPLWRRAENKPVDLGWGLAVPLVGGFVLAIIVPIILGHL